MKTGRYQSANEARLLDAGNRARQLREQLAITYAASSQIIDAMRKLREGIPLPDHRPRPEITLKKVDD